MLGSALRGLDRWEAAILGLLAAVAAAPLVVVLVRAGAGDAAWVGSASRNPADQLQYLAWIRDAGDHVLDVVGEAGKTLGFTWYYYPAVHSAAEIEAVVADFAAALRAIAADCRGAL